MALCALVLAACAAKPPAPGRVEADVRGKLEGQSKVSFGRTMRLDDYVELQKIDVVGSTVEKTTATVFVTVAFTTRKRYGGSSPLAIGFRFTLGKKGRRAGESFTREFKAEYRHLDTGWRFAGLKTN